MLGHGVTTIEAKSGYGLDLETEIRLVEVAYRLGREGPIDVVPTFLGAHAVAAGVPEPPGRRRGLRALGHRGPAAGDRGPRPGAVLRRLLRGGGLHRGPVAAGPDRGRRPTGWRPRLHADELAPSGGAELAAELGAASADHLATPSEAGIAALAEAAAADRAGRRDAPARTRRGSS